jgi:hypothetical protein
LVEILKLMIKQMSNNLNPYIPFRHLIFRSPYFPLNLLIEWLAKLDKSLDYLKDILVRPDIQEAIFLASPVLHDETSKYLENRLKPKERDKFFFSILKYLSRMGSRCTPFGLFAGCSVGYLAEHTDIRLLDPKCYSRHTRLDMNYLSSLAQDIAKRDEFKHRLLYYPNNSNYVVGDKLRYVEYRYHNGNRRHNIVAVHYSEYLQCLLAAAGGGTTIDYLITLLINNEISHEEALEFLHEMIDNQILVSELEPSVTGPELLEQIIYTLEKFDDQQELISSLKSLLVLLQEIKALPIGTTLSVYTQIKEQITTLGTSFNEKYLFQSDMLKPCEKADIGKEIADDVLQAITFLNKISLPSGQESLLDKFATSFSERYEEREIPLAQLLDAEMGLDFRQSGTRGDLNPLLDGIPFGGKQQENTFYAWNGIQSMLFRKVTETLIAKQQEVVLIDEDVKNLSVKWDDLPHTIVAMCEIFSYNSNGQSTIYLHPMGGSGAANLLGRFCHVDDKIYDAVKAIIQEEEQALPNDKLYAEIIHLPESRTGNVLSRPLLRQYEIPYLAKPAVMKEFQLELSDLVVSVRKRKFVLRSKRLNKEIIPILTTAHNYSYHGMMPIYQFLCNLQNQHKRGGIGLFLNNLFNEFPYLPRITYKNIILSLARWHVKPDEIKQIIESEETPTIEALGQWKTRVGIPRFVVLPDGDNELFTDTESITSLRMLYSIVRKRPVFILQEFPFNIEDAILKTKMGAFTNEFLITFHKKMPI